MGAGSDKDRAAVQELKDVVPCLAMDDSAWEWSYRLAGICRNNGTPVPTGDLLIAACAFAHGAGIEAVDKHFSTLEKYRAPSQS